MSTLAEIPVLSQLVRVLASAPTPEEIMAIRATDQEEERLSELMDRIHTTGLSSEEEKEVEMFLFAEHLVKMAKIEAHLRMRA